MVCRRRSGSCPGVPSSILMHPIRGRDLDTVPVPAVRGPTFQAASRQPPPEKDPNRPLFTEEDWSGSGRAQREFPRPRDPAGTLSANLPNLHVFDV